MSSILEAVSVERDREIVGNMLWTLAGLVTIMWAFQLYVAVTTYPIFALPVVLVGLWGMATIVAVWVPTACSESTRKTLQWVTLGVAILAFALWAYFQVIISPGYGTDELAFDQYAALLQLHGMNPYVHSMLPSFSLYQVSPNGYTFQLNGVPVSQLSYPALSFLLYVPFLALGWSTQLAVVVNAIAWCAGIALMFYFLPDRLKPLAIILGSMSVYIGYAVGGVTDALFVPLLIVTAYKWRNFVFSSGWKKYVGPVLFGLACCIKQTPWFVLPFVLGGLFREGEAVHGRKKGVRIALTYLAVVGCAFLVPNIPYIVASPGAWLSGMLTPLIKSTVPSGQGFVGLSLFLGLGGGSISEYSYAALLVMAAGWVLYMAFYPKLRSLAFLFPSIGFFFAPRSLASYLVMLVPAAIVAVVTNEDDALLGISLPDRQLLLKRLQPWKLWKWTVAGVVGVVGLCIVFTIVTPQPLGLQIQSVLTTGQLATVDRVTVKVTNYLDTPVRPTFTVDEGGTFTAFWEVLDGPATLPGRTAAVYTLLSPSYPAQPSIAGGFQVVAFTQNPGSMNPSDAYIPTIMHAQIVPISIDHFEPLNTPVTLHVDLLSSTGSPVHKAGVAVYLGQITYAEGGLVYSEARINGHPQGQTPVVAETNSQGQATFTVLEKEPVSDPVYFEANLIDSNQLYPFGYSSILAIRFGNSSLYEGSSVQP